MEEEAWVDIEGFEGLYKISNYGRVKSNERRVLFKGDHSKYIKERIRKHRKDGIYPTVIIYKKGEKHTIKVHREVAKYFIPNPNNLPQVNHIDGIKDNNHYSNLEWCTAKQNIKHSLDNNLRRINKGEEIHNSILKVDDVILIKKMLAEGKTSHTCIANKFGVCRAAVSQINRGKNWKHIK